MAPSHPDRRAAAAHVALAATFGCVWLVSARAQDAAPAAPAAAAPATTAPAQAKPAVTTGLPPGNSEMPINLEAASSDFDYKKNSLVFRRVKITQGGLVVTAQQASATGLEFENSEWRLQGDVRITVPGGNLSSNEARVLFRNNAIVRASIKGEPAAFEQRLRENDQVARGQAGSIDYNVQESTVRLTGNAWLSDGQNEIRGNTLVYDVGRERVQANPNEKDPGGVRITINPPRKTGTPAPTQGQGT
jgi:lipopolysaccharide transport protein LptA